MNSMLNTPQFSLRWNNYVSHVTGAFNLLREDNDLVDVTLCCEGKKIKAHKMLLSACSAYFKEIFKENPCQHPVVIFRNVKFDDLNAIINFMYHGEVSILQEQLESFLITAELLEVKGLTDSTEEHEDNESKSKSFGNSNSIEPGTSKINENIPYKVEEPINLAIQNPSNAQSVPTQSTSEMRVDSLDDVRFDSRNVEENKISNQMDPDEDMQIENQTTQTDTVDKNNSTESDLAKFRCQLCPKGFKHPTSLTLHKDSHAGKTQCPVCHRSFSRSYDMRSHLQKIHQGKQLTIKEIRYRSSTDVPVSKNYTHNM